MEQARERMPDLNFDLGVPSAPPSLEQFIFTLAPLTGSEKPSPNPIAPHLEVTDTSEAVSETPVSETVSEVPVSGAPEPAPAQPEAGSWTAPPVVEVPRNPVPPLQPPISDAHYLYQFRPQAINRTITSTADRIAMEAEDHINLLPNSAAAYFNQMLAQFEVFPVGGDDAAACLNFNPQAVSVISHLKVKSIRNVLTWEDLDRMEIALLSVMPESSLSGHSQALQAQYREAAGSDYFHEKNETDLTSAELRTELASLLNSLQQRRHLLPEQNQERSQLSHRGVAWIVGLCFTGLVIAGIGLIQPISHEAEPLVLLLAAVLSGAVGGFTSLLVKTQRTLVGVAPEYALEWQAWSGSPFVLPVLGAIFAAVLYLVFASFLSGFFLSGTLAGTSRLLLCGFAAGLAAGILPIFRDKNRSKQAPKA